MWELAFIAVSVGNSRTQIAAFRGEEQLRTERFANDQMPTIVQTVLDFASALGGGSDGSPSDRQVGDLSCPVVIASVNECIAEQLEQAVRDQLRAEIYHVGTDLPVPIGRQLDPERITGVDRLLNAAAAYDILHQACIVVDAGTAVTVDFVDGHGTFQGGAIAPGAGMQLRALHQQTASLPEVLFAEPDESFGRSTGQAMLQGVFHGIRGLVWKLVERYAEAYGAFPTVVATGGDAETLFEDDPLVDRIVPDLTMRGIATTVRTALSDSGESARSREE